MKHTLDLRAYRQGDESAILQLFQQSFNRTMPLEFWNWRFRDNPAAGPMIDLAWDGDALVAHYAVSPVTLVIGEEESLTALSMTTMTHPDYRGQGLFTTLASNLYTRMADQDYLMVWGFPNYQSHRGFVRNLAWEDIYEIPMFRLELSSLHLVPEVSGQIAELDNFDRCFDDLWETLRSDYNVIVKRDRKYLNWRFHLNPLNRYRVFGYLEDGQLLGYVVFKQYQTDVDIVDILANQESSAEYELVLAVLDFCRQNGVDGVNIWIPVRHSLHLALEKIGFRHSQPVTYFGARILKPSGVNLDATDIRGWYYTMGDCDVF
jgi:GNAT superfamily N-acetyltransferase